MSRLGLRARVVTASVVVLALGVSVVGFVVNLALTDRLVADADAVLRARADAQLATVNVRGGEVVVDEGRRDEALDRVAWVFVGGRAVARPPAPALVDRAAAALGGARGTVVRNAIRDVRLRAEPVRGPGGRQLATIVVAISLKPYEESERLARLATLVLAIFVVLAGGIVAWRAVGAGLRPVERMARQAASYTEHDLSGRFELGPPRDELTTLAATLDALLDRLEAGLRREQRLTAEIAHELRTPLSGMRAEAELGLQPRRSSEERREALATVVGEVDRLSSAIDALLATARGLSAQTATCELAEAIAEAVGANAAVARQRGVTLAVDEPVPPCRVGAEARFVARLLNPLLENAVRHADGSVHITAECSAGRARVRLSDDGPGMPAGEDADQFAAGSGASGGSGAGLGLALARRLARSLGGDVAVGRRGAGAELVVEIPAVAATPG